MFIHVIGVGVLLSAGPPTDAPKAPLPNILWITSEDNGPHLGCYGDTYADTPNLDRLAARATIYLRAWSNAPVCAPARTAIISGLYPPSTGSEHMRSEARLPSFALMFPQFLRAAGYYCTNNSKEDYNLTKPGIVWDESSPRAHWKHRAPGQPFFAVFNHTVTHESQIRARPHRAIHDPAKVRVPAYHPDTPEVRQDWAQYYDKLTEMDQLAGTNLKEIADAGLDNETIVFYFGDHGPGMPRCKRWPYDSGLHVPLIVHIPDRFAHLRPTDYVSGGRSDRLVSFVDFAPSVLRLAGIEPPAWLQGHAFVGTSAPRQPYVHGFRGRMDDRYDLVRSVSDGRFVYVRQYLPHLIYGQHIPYMFQTPTTRVWRQLFLDNRLTGAQARFWQTKPSEELYDLESDRDEVTNLASVAEHAETLRKLRAAQRELALRIRDVGFLPEDEIHRRAANSTPYEIAHDESRYPLERILSAAELASSSDATATTQIRRLLRDEESAVRYWGALGVLMRGSSDPASVEAVEPLLHDPSPSVRIVAAQALAQFGPEPQFSQALAVLVDHAKIDRHGLYLAVQSLNAIDAVDTRAAKFAHIPSAARLADTIRALPRKHADVPARLNHYVPDLIDKILADLADPK